MSKHRYLELKHFCLQYFEWEKAVNEITKFPRMDFSENISSPEFSDMTGNTAIDISYYTSRMDAVKKVCHMADEGIEKWLFLALTKDYTYPYLKSVLDIPCGRDYFYERYRRALWILSDIREKIISYNRN